MDTDAHAPASAPHIPSTPRPPTGPHYPTPAPGPASQLEGFPKAAHYIAIGTLLGAPAILLLPPRKLDLYTFTVASCGVIAGNHLVRERYGTGMLGLAGRRMGWTERRTRTAVMVDGLPQPGQVRNSTPLDPRAQGKGERMLEKVEHGMQGVESRAERALERFDLPTERARELHAAWSREKEDAKIRRLGLGWVEEYARHVKEHGWGYGGDMQDMLKVARTSVTTDARELGITVPAPSDSDKGGVRRENLASAAGGMAREPSEEVERGGVAGMAKKIWMGDEMPDWKEKRMQEEREALDEGRGYGSLIADQIWEVWNWDKKKNEDGELVPKKESKTLERQE